MIGAIGEPAAAYARPGGAEAGKRGDAVGQQAKASVAAAREAGAELPKNAQGIAASGIARGADPASIFAALITPVAEGDGTGDVGGVLTTDGLDDLGGTVPLDSGEGAIDAAPPAPLAPPPPPTSGDDVTEAGDGDADGARDIAPTVQVAVSDAAFSVDDGAIALELLTAASA